VGVPTVRQGVAGSAIMKYYAVCDHNTSFDEGEERDYANIWTVSCFPDRTGWNTDSGHDGYGLTRREAQFLADAANEKFERDYSE
jgi:hypothetical protein